MPPAVICSTHQVSWAIPDLKGTGRYDCEQHGSWEVHGMRKCGWAFYPVLADLPFSAADCWALGKNHRTPATVHCSTGWIQSLLEQVENPLRSSSLTQTGFLEEISFFSEWCRGGWVFGYFTKSLWISICRADLKSKMRRGLTINKWHPGPQHLQSWKKWRNLSCV